MIIPLFFILSESPRLYFLTKNVNLGPTADHHVVANAALSVPAQLHRPAHVASSCELALF